MFAMSVSNLSASSRRVAWQWLVGVLLMLLFAVVYLFNEALFLSLNHAGRHIPKVVWAFLSYFGDGLTAFALVLPFARKYPRLICIALIAAIIGLVESELLKYLTHVPRPMAVLPDAAVNLVGIDIRNPFSFPSGHSVTAFMFAGLLWPCIRDARLRVLMFSFASLVAFSRIMVGAHWPLDVLAGSVLGLFTAWLAHRIADKLRLGNNHWVHLALIGCYLFADYHLFGYNGGFVQDGWMGWTIGIAVLLIGLYSLIEIYFFPDLFYRRLYAADPEQSQ